MRTSTNVFAQTIALEKTSEGWSNHPTSDWYQGRGVFGGLIFAHFVHLAQEFGQFPIRRMNVDLCAPLLDKETKWTIQEMRRGSNSQFLTAFCWQDDKVMAQATMVLGGQRFSAFDLQAQNPQNLKIPETAPLPANPLMPQFTQHFQYWPTIGRLPFTKSSDLYCGGWIESRYKHPLTDTMIAALIDAWWPALALRLDRPRPMGTISCSIDFVQELPNQYGPCLLENQCQHIVEGYAVEHNYLWAPTGELLAIAQQNVVIIS